MIAFQLCAPLPACVAAGDNVQVVPQPDLQGATAHMSAEEVQSRLERKAEELKSDESLTQVGTGAIE